MDTEFHRRVSDLFLEACRLEGDARDVFLEESCADDTILRSRVEAMLRADESAHTLLDGSALDVLPELTDDTTVTVEVPHQIGPYRLEGEIDRGGMGTVHLAVHEETQRFVAIKVIRAGLATPQMLHRFAYEARLLARLHHPGIAQIFEASTYDSGHGPQPYLVMELVEGQPLMRYVRSHQLRTKRRLELMLRLCDAVQHAHQKGVIHRDLKPNNILVIEDDQPKILDFGVARDIEVDSAGAQTLVDVQQVAGTVPYMAPEQILGSGDDVDTRCDVYALGVIGYQLLSGRLPYPLEGKSIAEAARIIRDDEPDKLGTFKRRFRGDIENIFDKALSKSKDDRYPTAQSLGNDIRRYLDDEPITARRPPAATRARKFVRRHKTFVGGVVATATVLALGIAGMWWEREKAERMNEEAMIRHDEAARAEARVAFQRKELNARAEDVADLEATARAMAQQQGDLLDEAEQAAADALAAREEAEAARDTAELERLKALTSVGEAEQVVRFMIDLVDARSPTGLDRGVAKLAASDDLPPTTRALLHDALGVAFAEAGRTTDADGQFAAALDVFGRQYRTWRDSIPRDARDGGSDVPLSERFPDGAPRLGLFARVLLHQAHHRLATGRPRLAQKSATAASNVLRDLHGGRDTPLAGPALVRALATIDVSGVEAARDDIVLAGRLPDGLLEPTPRELAMLGLARAELLLHDGDVEAARRAHDTVTALRPQLPTADDVLARHDEFATRLHRERGDHHGRSNALRALYERQVVTSGPASPPALRLGVELVEALRLAGRFAIAEDVLEEMLARVRDAQSGGPLPHVDGEWTAARHVDLAGLLLDRSTPQAISTARMHTDLALAELEQLPGTRAGARRDAEMLHGRVLVSAGEADAAIPYLEAAIEPLASDGELAVERRRLALEALYDLYATRARWTDAERAAAALADVARHQDDALRRAAAQLRRADALRALGRHADEGAALRDAEALRLDVYGTRHHPEVTEIIDRLEALPAAETAGA